LLDAGDSQSPCKLGTAEDRKYKRATTYGTRICALDAAQDNKVLTESEA
jgi:hypothetical protein